MTTRTTAALLAGLALMAPLSAFAASASIQGLSPGTQMTVGQSLSFTVATDGFAGTPTFSAQDSFSGTTMPPTVILNTGAFLWSPQISDVGNHIITITVGDGSSTTTVQQTVFVNGAASAQIISISPGNLVKPGQNVTFQVAASGFGAPSYAVTDLATTTTVASTSISNSGYFSWTPQGSDAGAHTISVTVTDPQGHTATVSTIITVPLVPYAAVSGPAVTSVGASTTFSLSAPGFTNPVFSVRDDKLSSSITPGSATASTSFTWVPNPGDVGGHTLVFTATDSFAHSATASAEVEVQAAGSAAGSSSAATTTGPAGAPVVPSTTPVSGHASGLTATQVQAILSLLTSFGADSATIANVEAALGGSGGSTPAAGSSGYTFTSFLNIGSSGPEVTALQQKLAGLGFFSGQATGYFGQLTQAAVKAFQQAHGLDAFGYVGPGTRAALNQ